MNPQIIGYVGPGPGLTMFWAFLALLGTIALAVLYLLIWPFRMLLRKLRGTPPAANDTGSNTAAAKGSDTPAASR
jgi:hypothetical protein